MDIKKTVMLVSIVAVAAAFVVGNPVYAAVKGYGELGQEGKTKAAADEAARRFENKKDPLIEGGISMRDASFVASAIEAALADGNKARALDVGHPLIHTAAAKNSKGTEVLDGYIAEIGLNVKPDTAAFIKEQAVALSNVHSNFDSNQNVIALTDEYISSMPESERQSVSAQVIEGKAALLIATQTREIGEEYVKNILALFPNAELLISQVNKNVFFSVVEKDLFDDIANRKGEPLDVDKDKVLLESLRAV